MKYRHSSVCSSNRDSLVCVLDGPEDVSIKGQDVVDLGVRASLSCSANSETFCLIQLEV